jgi:hypothetical protein
MVHEMERKGFRNRFISGGEVPAQSQFTFSDDPKTSRRGFRGVKIVFSTVYRGKFLLFHGWKSDIILET